MAQTSDAWKLGQNLVSTNPRGTDPVTLIPKYQVVRKKVENDCTNSTTVWVSKNDIINSKMEAPATWVLESVPCFFSKMTANAPEQ